MAPQTIASGLSAKLTANAFTRVGYAFAGWATSSTGSVAYGDGAIYAIGNANVTLYAVWTIPYTVTYSANGGTGSPPVDGNGYASTAMVTVLGAGSLVYSGYSFAGWTTNSTSTGASASYAAGATFTMGSANLTLYAVWIPTTLIFSSSKTSITLTGFTTAPAGSFTIPSGVTSIGQNASDLGAFSQCAGLTSVTIPSSVTSIAVGAFDGTGLTSVMIPASVTSIGVEAFDACAGLTSITVDSGNPDYESISGSLYDKAGDTLIQAPGSISGSFTIPSGVTSIGGYAFAFCTKLTSVTIPISVTTIEAEAFSSCTDLTSATIPASVTSIGMGAFAATALTSVTIPASVTSIGVDAFSIGLGLTSIYVDSGNPDYESISGVLYDKAGDTLIQAPVGISGSFTIPSSVTSIGQNAFSLCSGLTNRLFVDSCG